MPVNTQRSEAGLEFDTLRERLKVIQEVAWGVKEQLAKNELECNPGANKGEMMANITLAYRHIEDARMRLGKAIQADDGGVSCYDRK